jgi:ABC-type phosphate transport system substrate-binding protein
MKNLKIISNIPAGFILTAVLLLCAALNVPAMGKKEPGPVKVTVSGTVRLVGSSFAASLVITGESREWYIVQAEESKLSHLQQQTVTVSGTEYYTDLVFANGVSAGRRYFLKDITVISPPAR